MIIVELVYLIKHNVYYLIFTTVFILGLPLIKYFLNNYLIKMWGKNIYSRFLLRRINRRIKNRYGKALMELLILFNFCVSGYLLYIRFTREAGVIDLFIKVMKIEILVIACGFYLCYIIFFIINYDTESFIRNFYVKKVLNQYKFSLIIVLIALLWLGLFLGIMYKNPVINHFEQERRNVQKNNMKEMLSSPQVQQLSEKKKKIAREQLTKIVNLGEDRDLDIGKKIAVPMMKIAVKGFILFILIHFISVLVLKKFFITDN